ncbi:MAG: CCA tRNA nucleotidyltransferase [Planctomycetota bacterium]|nr:CCA tRNA nucleotidyltransferase [Planctomycetota bacterium]
MGSPQEHEAQARSILESLRERGHRAYYAGGCVRDRVMGETPQDYDIATSASPETVQEIFDETVAVGARFGVIVVILEGNQFEVATFRAEGRYLDGRRPEWVRFADEEADVLRRDFTCNGMLYDPIEDRLLDRVGGQEDIEQKLIRTIGDPEERFDEDRLRLLRAVRFAARLGFRIDGPTADAIRKLADRIESVSWERIRDEVVKILTGPAARRGFELMADLGLLSPILPEVAALAGVQQPPQFHPEGDVFVHTMMLLELLETRTKVVSLAGLLHDIGKPPTFSVTDRIRFNQHDSVGAKMADAVCRRLRLSRQEREQIVDLVGSHMKFAAVKEMRESTLKRFLRKENFADHVALHKADCLASHGILDNAVFCESKIKEFEEKDREEALRPKALFDGHDLKGLGYKPGPLFREILSALEDAQLEGKLRTREEALRWLADSYRVP